MTQVVTPVGTATIIALCATAVALVIATRDVRSVLYDDAAITLRYAWRIAHADGFTYNPGDRTDGASAPLYTLLLAFINYCGGGLVGAAKAIGILSYGTVCGLSSYLASRIAGAAAGIIAPLLLLASVDFRLNALSGMESCLAAAIGMAALIALREGHHSLCGVLLGLDLFTRLDAGLLVIAVVGTVCLIRRHFPWRISLWCAAIVAPWLIFAQVYFRSVIPNSARVKVTVLARGTTLDHAWMIRLIQADHGLWAVAFALLSVPMILAFRDRDISIAIIALILWPVFHLLAYSFINLGAEYPWYIVVLYPPISCGAAIGIAGMLSWALHLGRRMVSLGVLGACVAVFGAVVLAMSSWPGWTITVDAAIHGHKIDGYEMFEATRRETGIYLATVTKPGQVLETCFGWPAFEDESAVIKETCPLNTRKSVGPPKWGTNVSFPAYLRPKAPPGAKIVAVFDSPLGGDSWVYEFTK